MKADWSGVEAYRVRSLRKPGYESTAGDRFGVFFIKVTPRLLLRAIVDDGAKSEHFPAWEHVSVSAINPLSREQSTPTWDDMTFVKGLFWEPEECVLQFHPPESEYVNIHQHVLHLWRPCGVVLPRPPMELV